MPESIRFSVRDFCGCAKADIEVQKITLLTGANRQGKSSTLDACTSAITGILAEPAMKKADLPDLVREGQTNGSVQMARGTEDGVQMKWPSGENRSTGRPPRASLIACGMASIVTMPLDERAKTLGSLIKADPTAEDVDQAFQKAGLASTTAGWAWGQIEKVGWDETTKLATERGKDKKREWREITTENYGSSKGAAWSPAGFLPEFQALGLEALQAKVVSARATLEASLQAQGGSDTEIKSLQDLADSLEISRQALTQRSDAVQAAESAVKATKAAHDALPSFSDKTMCCPHCEGIISIQSKDGLTTLIKGEEITPAEKEERRKAKVEASLAATRADTALREAIAAKGRAEADVTAALQAAKRLAEHKTNGTQAETKLTVEETKHALAVAEKNVGLLDSKIKADKAHAEIERMGKIAEILAPDGIRKVKLSESLDAFNDRLSNLCEVAGWPEVQVAEDLGFSIDARRKRLSKSEQYRIRVTIQIAIAQIDASEMVAIDDAEILDGKSRNGLMKMLMFAEIPAIVAMTAARKDVPDLAAFGWGATYWCQTGTVGPLPPLPAVSS